MLEVDKQSRVPVYEQLIERIENLILHGIWMPKEQIPSVRMLSVELFVNPNTVQKAYNDLERRGITASVPGVGRYVCENAVNILKREMKESLSDLQNIIENYAKKGVSMDKIIDTVKETYQKVLNKQ